VLAGFSQGGAAALSAGLRSGERLAAEKSAANADVPILMCHGRMDPVVPIAMGIEARDVLSAQGYAVAWHEYPMQHEVCAAELGQIGRWLPVRLGTSAG
jgi:phospholipase/carboxylesterase